MCKHAVCIKLYYLIRLVNIQFDRHILDRYDSSRFPFDLLSRAYPCVIFDDSICCQIARCLVIAYPRQEMYRGSCVSNSSI